MLVMRVKLTSISPDDIAKECSISKTTFKRYYKLLCDNHLKLKKVFKIHRIPMDKQWQINETSRVNIKNMFNDT